MGFEGQRFPVMSTIASTKPITPEEFLIMPDAVNYELVDGNLVERNMGMESSKIAARILVLLGIFMENCNLGHLFTTDASYQCFPDDPSKVRRPDVSFIQFGRLPGERVPRGHCRIAPDLAVEVISPGDLADDVEEKVAQYIRAGIRLIWIVYPSTRTVRVHRPRSSPLGPVSELSEGEAIEGEDVVPGFSCPIAKFFA